MCIFVQYVGTHENLPLNNGLTYRNINVTVLYIRHVLNVDALLNSTQGFVFFSVSKQVQGTSMCTLSNML